MVGGGIKVKPSLVEFPLGVVTETAPLDPAATTAVILVAEFTTKDAAGVPPKLTPVAAVKLVPEMVTVPPVAAVRGVKLVTTGGCTAVKPGRVALPPGVTT